MAEEQVNSDQLRKNRRVLLGIFGIPVLVVGLSTLLYYMVTSGMVELGTVNNGELVTPPLKFSGLPLKAEDGSPFDYSKPEQKWAFLVIGDGDCSGDCDHMLYVARQSIIALGKKMDRVRLIYLTRTGNIGEGLRQRFDKEYRGMDVITVDDQALIDLFAHAKAQPDQPRSFFVVDPHGWLMMFYQVPDTEQHTLTALGKAVLQDMKRLIK